MIRMLLPIATAALAACGGDVVVDDSGDTGGGTSASSSTTSGTGSAPSGCISVPEVESSVGQCTADPSTCSISCVDGGHSWQVKCFEKACQCIWDNNVICLCSVAGSEGTICNGNLPPCCPEPWINP